MAHGAPPPPPPGAVLQCHRLPPRPPPFAGAAPGVLSPTNTIGEPCNSQWSTHTPPFTISICKQWHLHGLHMRWPHCRAWSPGTLLWRGPAVVAVVAVPLGRAGPAGLLLEQEREGQELAGRPAKAKYST